MDKTYSLNIASLARIIGPSSKLNPLLLSEGLYTGSSYSKAGITESIPDGVYSYSLKYKNSSTGVTITDSSNNAFASVNLSTLGNGTNQYYYNSDKDEIIFAAPSSSLEVTYSTRPEQYSGGASYSGATYNMIPDESQLSSGGILLLR